MGIKADVTVPADVAAMVGEINRRWGGTDVLVHNALTSFAIIVVVANLEIRRE